MPDKDKPAYVILESTTPQGLVRLINNAHQDGYEPVGGPFVVPMLSEPGTMRQNETIHNALVCQLMACRGDSSVRAQIMSLDRAVSVPRGGGPDVVVVQ